MTPHIQLRLLFLALMSCTDVGVIGERAQPRAGAGGANDASAAGSACLFGVCELPPFCSAPDAFCIFCESDADCTRDPADRFCSPVYSTCVACLTDGDCGPDAPYCDGGECESCSEDEHCPEGLQCNDGRCERD